jgi:hypothetical protein
MPNEIILYFYCTCIYSKNIGVVSGKNPLLRKTFLEVTVIIIIFSHVSALRISFGVFKTSSLYLVSFHGTMISNEVN